MLPFRSGRYVYCIAHDGKVFGTFANYYRFVRDPSPVDRELTEMITRTAAMAIERARAGLAVSA